jgi:predicted MFS family arabinose efflux permease
LENTKKFIKVYGYALVLLFIITSFSIYFYLPRETIPDNTKYFGITISLWYLITGVGILSMKKWGYYLFKFFLYFLIIVFPIGTIVSYKSLKFIKKNKIRDMYFS